MGKERTKETLETFFAGMTEEERQSLEAIAMDMWTLYSCGKKHVPHVKIVFDLFRMVSGFGKVIDKVRNAEYQKRRKRTRTSSRVQNIFVKNKRNIRRKNTGNISNSSCHSMKQ
ncbi:MAG: transposase [Planctomycetia bacterium]|nr:transposase [Planctomycetia bacterium]